MEKKEEFYKVKISQNEDDTVQLNTREIIFIKSKDSWNDFSYHIHYTFKAVTLEGKIFKGKLFLWIALDEKPKRKAYGSFFSMLPTMQEYRSLIREIGIKEANFFLDSVNDVVYLQTDKSNTVALDFIKVQDVFKFAFMRNSESFFTYHNAVDILKGLEHESVSSISTTLDLSFKLDSFINEHKFTFTFNLQSILPKRISAVIGKNGIGKSQTLHNIVKSLLNKNLNLFDPSNERPMLNRLLAIATPGETRNTFPNEKENAPIYYKRLLLTRDSSHSSGDWIVQLLRSKDSIKNKSRFTLFLKSLKEILGEKIDNLVISVSPDNLLGNTHQINGRAYLELNMLNSQFRAEQKSLEAWASLSGYANPYFMENNKVYPLSSGQYAFYFFALQACLMIENGTLVLLDEPETHLHPNYISSFISLLDKLLELTGSTAIIATHSSYIIRELPRTQVHVLKEDDKKIKINQPRLKTFGADIGEISYFVFEDEITNRLIKKLKKQLKKKPELFEELKDELSLEAIMHLQRFLEKEDSY